MSRKPNTNSRGENFGLVTIDQVWKKGTYVSGFGLSEVRADICGKHMKRSEYGNTNSDYGWEIDHKKPVAKGGGDELENLQPLQWQNNRKKGDIYPWSC